MCKCKAKKRRAKKCGACGFIGRLAAILAGVYALLFVVFYFDLDGKALFYGVEPFLKNHYDNMARKDMLKTEYSMDKFPKYEF